MRLLISYLSAFLVVSGIHHIKKHGLPAHNSGLAKVAVQCSADILVVNQILVLRINICGKNRHLCQAANRCATMAVQFSDKGFANK